MELHHFKLGNSVPRLPLGHGSLTRQPVCIEGNRSNIDHEHRWWTHDEVDDKHLVDAEDDDLAIQYEDENYHGYSD